MEKAENRKLLRDLYPDLTETEIEEVEENLEKYLDLLIRIYEQVTDDPALAALLNDLLDHRREEK